MKKLVLALAWLVLALPALAQPQRTGPLSIQNSLSELAGNGSAAQAAARANLGLGTAATQPGTAFDAAGLAAAEATRATAAEAVVAASVAGEVTRALAAEGTNATAAAAALAKANLALPMASAGPLATQAGASPSAAAIAALGFAPYSAANPSAYVNAAEASAAAPVQTVAGRTGSVALGVGDVSGAATASSVTAETTRASGAETANTTAIGSETTRATAAEGINAGAISTETTRATAAEGTKLPLSGGTLTGPLILGAPGSTGDVSGMSATASSTTTARTLAQRAADLINVKDGYGGQPGAKGDGQIVSATVTLGAGSSALTVGTNLFTAADVGKAIVVGNAGAAPTTGPVETVPVTSPGSGYTSAPTCAVVDGSGGGTGATCSALMVLRTATVVSAGATCLNGSFEMIVGIDGLAAASTAAGFPTGTPAKITGTTASGAVSGAVAVNAPGMLTSIGNIANAPAYGFNCGTAPTFALNYGVGAVQITAIGAGYSTNQTTVFLSGGSPSAAAALGTPLIGAPVPPLTTTILTYVSPTQVTLAAPAATAVGGADMLLWATDDHVALQKAINAGTGIYIPPGIYWTGSGTLDPGTGSLAVMGAGEENTILAFNNGTSVVQDSGDWTPLFKRTSGPFVPPANGYLDFQNFQIRGLLDFGRVNVGAPVMELNAFKSISQDHLTWFQIGAFANQNEGIGRYIVTNNIFNNVVRDQARCRSCFSVYIGHNKFMHSDDDSVALHQAASIQGAGAVREDLIVEDNEFEDTLCIHILGARSAVIRGNVGRRCKVQGVNLAWTAGEGPNQLRSLLVADNSFNDVTTRNGSAPAPCAYCFTFVGPGAPSGVTSFVPGSPAGINWFGKPWDYDLNNAVNATQFSPSARAIDIHDNSTMRTLPAVANYSAWNLGKMLSLYGFIDPPMPDTMLRPMAGISTSVNATDQTIHDNSIQNVRRGIVINDTVVAPSQVNLSILYNHIYDAWEYGIVGFGTGYTSSLDIIGNAVDVDPYLISPGRTGVAGGWTSGFSASSGLSIFYNGLAKVALNTFSNAYSVQDNAGWIATKNVVRGQPFNGTTGQLTGWTSANFGMGAYPLNVGDRWFISPTNSNPNGAFSGLGAAQLSRTLYAAAAPTSGYHVIGDIVGSTAPGACTCSGWLALTTGSAWVAGTDFKSVPIQ